MEFVNLKDQAKFIIIKDLESLYLESILAFYDSYLDLRNY